MTMPDEGGDMLLWGLQCTDSESPFCGENFVPDERSLRGSGNIVPGHLQREIRHQEPWVQAGVLDGINLPEREQQGNSDGGGGEQREVHGIHVRRDPPPGIMAHPDPPEEVLPEAPTPILYIPGELGKALYYIGLLTWPIVLG
ncbi:hypothetical protein BDP27DRAFT_1366063 [Rhodocollybia butyracea]|uniref:Uncharacterized protein n=1 Tax=Rhodocollybia butyracea TaxID=206335 RepID=A0A9P5U4R7_9AGAR|nr:hypothetical protein BDP27DRAFT_1366063 [Rhodocollybia butyracea]